MQWLKRKGENGDVMDAEKIFPQSVLRGIVEIPCGCVLRQDWEQERSEMF
jgi:hypothetical protein